MIHIIGAGSIGSLVAWHLAKSGLPVTLLLRNPSPHELVHGRSLAVKYQDPFERLIKGGACHVGVEASSTTASPIPTINNLIVATKVADVASALTLTRERLTASSNILFLQNGSLGVYESVRTIVPRSSNVSFGICTHGAYRAGIHWDVHSFHGSIGSIKMFGPCDLSLDCLGDSSQGAKAAEASSDGLVLLKSLSKVKSLDAEILQDHCSFIRLVYLKLAVNCALNPATALLDCYNEGLTTPRGREIVAQVGAELFQLLGKDRLGVEDPESLNDKILKVASETGRNVNSMCQDIRAGKRTEIDYLNGYVARWAEERGLKAPVNSLLTQLIKAREQMDVNVLVRP